MTALWLIVDIVILKKQHSILTIVLSLIGINFTITSYIDLSMWYITFLFIWYIAFYIIFKAFSSYKMQVVMFIIVSILLYVCYIPFSPLCGYNLYILDFPLGVLLGLNYSKILKIQKRTMLNILLAISIIGIILSVYLSKNIDSFAAYTISNFTITLPIICLVVILLECLKINIELFSFVGGISYEVYLFEWMLIARYGKIFKVIPTLILKEIAYFILVVILAISLKKVVKVVLYCINGKPKINKIATQ